MQDETPLKLLSKVLCGASNFAIFENQTEFYQIIIMFSSNKINGSYGFSTTDELIPHIKKYLRALYENKSTTEYSYLHKAICQNILNQPVDYVFNHCYGNNLTYLSEISNLDIRFNINKIINNQRKLTKAWICEYARNQNNIDVIIHRIFWLLQYFYVYYAHNTDDITKNNALITYGDYIEFFTIPYDKKKILYKNLLDNCGNLSNTLKNIDVYHITTHILSRIIFDIIESHLNYINHIPLSYLNTAIDSSFDSSRNIASYSEQLNEFINHIDAFGDRTLDRLHILEEYADNNFYAANELGGLYFFGADMLFGPNNHYILEPDYKKAIYYYLKAIHNSNPPYPVSCWSIGYIIVNGYCSEDCYENNIAEAMKYFKMAGNYAPAYNNIAQILLKEAEIKLNDYKEKTSLTTKYYINIINKFVEALEMSKKAADNKWFYGHNVIAQFIRKHKQDTKLLLDIKDKISFPNEFNTFFQLKASAKYKNPWAMHELALYYKDNNQLSAAESILLEACSFEYNKAFYTLAMDFYSNQKRIDFLIESSNRNYPFASYELALIYYNQNNYKLSRSFLMTAEQQNISLPLMNLELNNKINLLAKKLR